MKQVFYLIFITLLGIQASALPALYDAFKGEAITPASPNLKSFDKKNIVVAFWASWCGVCRKSIPLYIKEAEKYKAKGLEFIAISEDDDKKEAIEHQKEHKYPVHVYHDKEGALKQALLLEGVPVLFVYDKENNQVMRFSGYSEKKLSSFSKTLEKLMNRK